MQVIPYRETIQRCATGERKYIRYFDGRGHFAHLRLEVLPRSELMPSVTAASNLELPDDCYQAARAALFRKMERGPIQQLPMIGLEARLIAATHLLAYSYPNAFASVACMAFDEALKVACPVVVEPWVGLRMRVDVRAIATTLAALTGLLGEVRMEISLGECFIVKAEIPIRLTSKLRAALRIKRLNTFPLRDEQRYKPVTGPLDGPTPEDTHSDWT